MSFDLLPRSSGILLHPTSFPSPYGIGDLGPCADEFVDALSGQGMSVWQMLPFTPTDPGCYHSPYSSTSAFAGNSLLISPDRLFKDGMIDEGDLPKQISSESGRVDFAAASARQRPLFDAVMRKTGGFKGDADFDRFLEQNKGWLEDYARYAAFKEYFNGKAWSEWPSEIRDRDPRAMDELSGKLEGQIQRQKAIQYLFAHQWAQLQGRCREKGVLIFGDMPIYVQLDSADVWSHPELFRLDENKIPTHVAGVPPDYFSADGQLWGHPIYDWKTHQRTEFGWWRERFRRNVALSDIVRLDHFRGFVGFWVVNAGEKTAKNGKWEEAPADELFRSVMTAFPNLMVVAEDLGDISPDVHEKMGRFGFPGMKILQFAFSNTDEKRMENSYLPHNFGKNSVVFTGTHDNDTLASMLGGATEAMRQNMWTYLGGRDKGDLYERIVNLAFASAARLAIVSMQDALKLGGETRFNTPGTTGPQNWSWRLTDAQFNAFVRGIYWFQDSLEMTGRVRRKTA